MKIDAIHWQQTCCAWHGEYAEIKTKDGGAARIKRAPDVDGFLVMRFGADNLPTDKGADGTPAYVPMTEAEVESLLIF